jgi:hypothetical protein
MDTPTAPYPTPRRPKRGTRQRLPRRRPNRSPFRRAPAAGDDRAAAQGQPAGHDLASVVDTALAHLDEHARRLFLHCTLGLTTATQRELAEELGLSLTRLRSAARIVERSVRARLRQGDVAIVDEHLATEGVCVGRRETSALVRAFLRWRAGDMRRAPPSL